MSNHIHDWSKWVTLSPEVRAGKRGEVWARYCLKCGRIQNQWRALE